MTGTGVDRQRPSRRTDTTVLIPAAGTGDRLGMGPKAFLELAGRPMVAWVAEKALAVSDDVVVALPDGLEAAGFEICPGCRIIAGGPTRQDTVARLATMTDRPWSVLINGANPLASIGLIWAVLEAAQETGVAGAFLASEVPAVEIRNGRVISDFPRHAFGIVQTPQAFATALLKTLTSEALRENRSEQSTIQLALRAGRAVVAVPGEKTNLKITDHLDWLFATQLAGLLTSR